MGKREGSDAIKKRPSRSGGLHQITFAQEGKGQDYVLIRWVYDVGEAVKKVEKLVDVV